MVRVLIGPKDRFYQVILERCIEGAVNDHQWEMYKDGDLYIDAPIAVLEIQRAENLYHGR